MQHNESVKGICAMLMSSLRRAACSVLAVTGFALVFAATACAQNGIPVTWSPALGVNQVHPESLNDVAALLTKKWTIALKDQTITERIKVHGSGSESMMVDSCKKVFMADKKGLGSARSYRQTKVYRSWAAPCYALRALGRATPAQRSFVKGFVLDAEQVKALPVAMAPAISSSDRRKMAKIRDAGGTLGDYIGDKSVEVEANKQGGAFGTVTVRGSDGGQSIQLLAKGDFNHDDIEDLLLSTYVWVTGGSPGGSYAAHGLFVVSRMGKGGPLKVVKEIPVMGP